MKRLFAIVLVAIGVLSSQLGTAQASNVEPAQKYHVVLQTSHSRLQTVNGWERYKGREYVRWNAKIIPLGDPVSMVALRYNIRALADARKTAIKRHTAYLKALAARQQQPVVSSSSNSTATYSTYHGSLQALVCSYNWSCTIASCIVGRESGWSPTALNPSGAAGLFQLMAYPDLAHAFNPVWNVATAYTLYTERHWEPWAGGSYSCGF